MTEKVEAEINEICIELTQLFNEQNLVKYDGDKLVTYLIEELAKARCANRELAL